MFIRGKTRRVFVIFSFSMFLNDIEDVFFKNGLNGIDVNMFKIFLLLYADDIVIFADLLAEL